MAGFLDGLQSSAHDAEEQRITAQNRAFYGKVISAVAEGDGVAVTFRNEGAIKDMVYERFPSVPSIKAIDGEPFTVTLHGNEKHMFTMGYDTYTQPALPKSGIAGYIKDILKPVDKAQERFLQDVHSLYGNILYTGRAENDGMYVVFKDDGRVKDLLYERFPSTKPADVLEIVSTRNKGEPLFAVTLEGEEKKAFVTELALYTKHKPPQPLVGR